MDCGGGTVVSVQTFGELNRALQVTTQKTEQNKCSSRECMPDYGAQSQDFQQSWQKHPYLSGQPFLGTLPTSAT